MNTNKKTARLLLSLAAAAILSACSSAQQAAAPVVSGTNTGGYGYNNGTVTTPYGTVNTSTTGNYGYNNGTVTTPYGTVNTSTTGNYGYNNGAVTTPYGTVGTATDTANNPYNTAPYTPVATNTSTTPYTPAATITPTAAPYTPAASTAPTYTPPASTGRTFVPNYSPVDKNASTHRVQAGDTVYNISKRYGISQEQLMQWNNLSGTTLSVGQTLRVKPVGSSSRTNAAPVTAAKTGTGSQHKVVAGDTVYNISKRYGISQEQLRQWNNLNGNNIQLGQVLRVSQSGRATSTATIAAAAAPYVPAKQPAPVAATTTNTAATTTTATTPAVVATPAPVVASVRTQTKDGIVWQSPLPNGSITQEFGTNRGMLIDGKGANAVAVADGQVIHIGALRNYGNLLIVQHSDQYLTAYAQIASALVQNGQKVVRGQPVATLGSNKLLFEVRSDGKAVNPTTYIPF